MKHNVNHRTHRCVALLSLLVLSGLIGCASVQSPTVSFVEVQEADRSTEATRLDFIMLVSNENSEPLPLRDLSYQFALDGQAIHATMLTAQATVPQHEQSRVVLPVIVRHDASGNPPTGVRSYSLTGNLTYETAGKLAEALYDLKVRVPSVSFSDAGTVEF